MNVSEIVLQNEEQVVFDKFLFSDSATLTREEFDLLRKKGLIIGAMDGKSDWFDGLPLVGLCSLSQLGKDMRVYQHAVAITEKRDNIRYWLPIILSNLIAIMALVVAILK